MWLAETCPKSPLCTIYAYLKFQKKQEKKKKKLQAGIRIIGMPLLLMGKIYENDPTDRRY